MLSSRAAHDFRAAKGLANVQDGRGPAVPSQAPSHLQHRLLARLQLSTARGARGQGRFPRGRVGDGRGVDLGFGRSVASETEAPNMLVNLV